jgi:hypothetical protein
MHKGVLVLCNNFRFLTSRIGGVHNVIWVHEISGMWRVKSRFVAHKCINHSIDDFVE